MATPPSVFERRDELSTTSRLLWRFPELRFSAMKKWLSLLVFLLFSGGSCARPARLGPKDGAGLPARDLDRVKVGDTAPDFTLEDADGRPVTLSDFRGKKLVILVFYRGHW